MIELRKLTKAFGSKVALRGVDLSVAAGESLVIFGPNGAGKSTLIRLLACLSRPTGGTVRIGGYDLNTHAEGIRRYLGVVSHAPLLYDSLTAEENLRFFGRLYGVAGLEARISDMLAQVGLAHRRDDLVRTFSRGMVQRLAIARALLHDPQLLLLDEPDTGLDPQAAEMLHGLLAALSRGAGEDGSMGVREYGSMGVWEYGSKGGEVEARQARPHAHTPTRPYAHTPTPPHAHRTIVTVTHSIERGLAIADRVVILANGRIVFDAAAQGMTAAEFRPLYDRYVSS